MTAKGLSARTALQCHRVLGKALRTGVRWGAFGDKLPPQPEAPSVARYEAPVLSQQSLENIISAAEDTDHGCLIYTALFTGLRLSELRGLRWEDLDLEAGILSVRQTCQWLAGQGFSFRPPKSTSSVRALKLTAANVQQLKHHRNEQTTHRLSIGLYQDHDLVFASPTGAPQHPSTFRDAWKKIRSDAGVTVRFHDLRHAHASLLIRDGAHPKMISERLGHAGIQVTMDTYAHLMPGVEAEKVANLDGWLANG
jgi:integrase